MIGRQPAVLALDIGTTEAKGGLVGADGTLLGSARAGYALDLDLSTGSAEQDPEAWWRAVVAVVRQLAGQAGSIGAICCVGQGPTLVAMDDAGRGTRTALTWMDRRGSEEAGAVQAATGLAGFALGILPAARWVERHEPDVAAATRWYLNTWEWAAFRFTGVAARTRSPGQPMATAEQAAASGITADRLPPVIDAGMTIGVLRADVAVELGLAAGIVVVAGTVDSFAGCHGAGLIDAGDAVDTGGTSGGLAVYADRPVEIPNTWVAPAPLAGRWIVGGAMTATGRALDWFRDEVLGGGTEAAGRIREASAAPPGADGLLFLPYLAGERSPIWDPLARGAFVGLTLRHGAAHLGRAILEAAAFALRHVALPIVESGLVIPELRVTGGTAAVDAWNQIKADVLGVPVAAPEVRDAALLGAAILAAPGLGWHADTVAAIRAMVRIERRWQPNPDLGALYDELFAAYLELWPAIATTVHRLAALPASAE